MTKDRTIYILTIHDCLQRIQDYTKGYTAETFANDPKTQDAVIRNLEVLGQAAKDFGIEELTRIQPSVPWTQITGMRNIIAHEYLGLDMTIVWEVVEHHVHLLKEATEQVASELNINLKQT